MIHARPLRHVTAIALACALALVSAHDALATTPDPLPSYAEATGTPASWMIAPDGTGPRLDEIGVTITVHVIDNLDQPIAGFPFQDVYVDDSGNGDLTLCQGGSVADANSDANGVTTITSSIAGGGWTQSGVTVYLSGLPIPAVLDIQVVSPDIDGDLQVSITDLYAFSVDYLSETYAWRSDLWPDGRIDLTDVSVLAQYIGSSCP